MKIFLTGSTGFVGSHLLARLLNDGHCVRALVRDRKYASSVGPKFVSQLEFVEGDVTTGSGLEQGTAGCEAVVHLVGIIIESGAATFENIHARGTRNVVTAAQKSGIRHFVQMSALGAKANGVSGYQTSKWNAEETVRGSSLNYVILRPSLIYGPRDGFVSQMVQVMKSSPLIRPVVGTGKYLFRPIFIADVVECFVQSLTNTVAENQTIELGGPEKLTLEQMLDEIAACVGVKKPAVHVPFSLMYFNAAILGALLRRPPVTTDQLRMLREGSTCDIGPMQRTFNLKPVTFHEGLQSYLCGG